MLVIRLSRKGRRNFPMYRLQVAENSMPTDGKFVEIVGSYNPTATDQPLEVKKDRVEYWISKGAQPSNTVAKLLNKVGFNLPVEQGNKAPKKKATAKSEAAKVAPVADEIASTEEKKEEIPNNPPVGGQDDGEGKEVSVEEGTEAKSTEEATPIEEKTEDSVEESKAEEKTEAPAENNPEEAEAPQQE